MNSAINNGAAPHLRLIEQTADQTDTKERLLDAALRVFAERGFHGASIRDICKCAGTNVSTINYYFHGKEKLYHAVVELAIQSLAAQIPVGVIQLALKTSAPGRRDGIQPLFLPHPSHDRSLWPVRLIVRQLVEPGPDFDNIVSILRTLAGQLEGSLRQVLGPRAEPEMVQRCALNLFCQYLFCRATQATFHLRDLKSVRHNHSNQFIACIARPADTVLNDRDPAEEKMNTPIL